MLPQTSFFVPFTLFPFTLVIPFTRIFPFTFKTFPFYTKYFLVRTLFFLSGTSFLCIDYYTEQRCCQLFFYIFLVFFAISSIFFKSFISYFVIIYMNILKNLQNKRQMQCTSTYLLQISMQPYRTLFFYEILFHYSYTKYTINTL